jgi:hypothetical protein
MTSRTFYAIGICAVAITIMTGAEFALARGGGGGGGQGNGAQWAGEDMSRTQADTTYQNQYKKQKRYQYRQENVSTSPSFDNGMGKEDNAQNKTRTQLRDPSIHNAEVSE